MSTIWAAPAPTRVLNLRGAPVAERRPGDDDDDTDDPATGPHGAKPSSSRAGDEPFEDVAGAARGPRVGRIDAWRDQGFASAREQRDALKSDLGRYNARRRGQGRAPLTEDEFDAMIARGNNDEVSSISGSDDSDSDSDSDDGEDGGEAGEGRGAYAAVRGAEQGGAQIVFEDDAGERRISPFGDRPRRRAKRRAEARRERRGSRVEGAPRRGQAVGGCIGARRALCGVRLRPDEVRRRNRRGTSRGEKAEGSD